MHWSSNAEFKSQGFFLPTKWLAKCYLCKARRETLNLTVSGCYQIPQGPVRWQPIQTIWTQYLRRVFSEAGSFRDSGKCQRGVLNCHNYARRLFPFLYLGRQQETQELLTLGLLKEMTRRVEVNWPLVSEGSNPVWEQAPSEGTGQAGPGGSGRFAIVLQCWKFFQMVPGALGKGQSVGWCRERERHSIFWSSYEVPC